MKKLFVPLIVLLSCTLSATAQRLPDFSFSAIGNKKITPASLPANKPVIVFFFDPYCDHCEKQAEWIKKDLKKLDGITLLWVSTEALEEINSFAKKYFPSSSNTIFCGDGEFMFDQWFGYSEVPSIYVYDKNRNRVKAFDKETPVEELLKPLK